MRASKLIIALFVFFSFLARANNLPDFVPATVAYRVIRTNPQEFVSALRIAPIRPPAGVKVPKSRLDRFYQIKSKEISGKDVIIEIVPHVPILSEYFPSHHVIKVRLNEVFHQGDRYIFDTLIYLTNSRYLKAKMDIDRNEMGSLLRVSLVGTNYNQNLIKAFQEAALALNFIFPTAEAAENDARSH